MEQIRWRELGGSGGVHITLMGDRIIGDETATGSGTPLSVGCGLCCRALAVGLEIDKEHKAQDRIVGKMAFCMPALAVWALEGSR